MESGGEAENSLRENLEVSVTVEDLKVILGRLGDLEDPYFKHLEVIRESQGLCLAKFGVQEASDVQGDDDQQMVGGSEVNCIFVCLYICIFEYLIIHVFIYL